MLFAVVLTACVFMSCSKDEENDDKDYAALIVGKWKIESASDEVDEDEAKCIFDIKSDGTYRNGDGSYDDDKGTWIMNGNKFIYTSQHKLTFTATIEEISSTHFKAKIDFLGYIRTAVYKRVN